MSKFCEVTNTAEVEFEHGQIYVTAELELEWVDDSFTHEFGVCHKGHYEVEMVRKVEYFDYETGKPIDPEWATKIAIEDRCWQYRFSSDGSEL